MAKSATIAISPSTYRINEVINAVVTVTNNDSSAVNVLSCKGIAVQTGDSDYNATPVGMGVVNLGPGANIQVAASGSLALPFSLTFFAPSNGILGGGAGTYSVGATIYLSDGSVLSPTAALVTVNAQPFLANEQ